jgi:hypothetical protein
MPSISQIKLSFQVCPIILSGGIASQIPGGILPMMNLMYPAGDLAPTILPFFDGDLDNAFAAFNVLPGGTLVQQSIGKYPFANQWVGANAVIAEPLTLSVIMDTPMRGDGGTPGDSWQIKQSVFSNLKGALDNHNNVGGLYTVVTPAYMYQNLILTALTDNSRGNNSIPQNAWRFDFEKPLITIEDAQNAYNLQMQKINNQVPVGANQSGILVGTPVAAIERGGTPRIAGALSGGNPTGSFNPTGSNNYPTLPSPAAFPFTGIS